MKKTKLAQFTRNNLRSISSKNRINFFRQMSILTRSGVTILDAFRMLHRSAKGPIKSFLRDTIAFIEQGNDFSSISKYYTNFLDVTMTNMIKAGEQTGTLPEVLQQIYENLHATDKFKRKIRGAMAMPIITLLIAFLVVFYISFKVVPSFAAFLSQMGSELPALTVFVVDFSNYVVKNWKFILQTAGGYIFGFILMYKIIKPFRILFHYIFLGIPLVGKIILYTALTNFANSMSKLISSGVGVIDSMNIANNKDGLWPFHKVVSRSIYLVSSGKNISAAFMQSKLIPHIFADLIQAGEESGKLDHAFEQLAIIYKEEANYKIEILQTMIQPIMTIIIGGIVAVVAGSLIMGMVALWSKNGM